MILELVFEWHSQDAVTWGNSVRGSSLTEQQVNEILVQGCAAPLSVTAYFAKELLTKFPDSKCNCAADGMCMWSMDLVGNDF